jgi:hypothetical protein
MNFATQDSDHKFFTFMSLATFTAVTVGFGNFYGHRLVTQQVPIATVIHIHGAVFLAWILTFVLQVYFAAKNKITVHMKVGKAAIFIAVAMLLSGFMTSLYAAKTGHMGIPGVEFPTIEGFLLLNLSSLTVFIILTSAGWIYRNKPQFHKRFMLMATVAGLAPPGISRLPGLSGTTPAIAGTVLVFILLGPLYDLKFHKKIHRAYLYSLPLVIFILPPVVTILSSTSVWLSVTQFLLKSI